MFVSVLIYCVSECVFTEFQLLEMIEPIGESLMFPISTIISGRSGSVSRKCFALD